jgi:hypothetical protein
MPDTPFNSPGLAQDPPTINSGSRFTLAGAVVAHAVVAHAVVARAPKKITGIVDQSPRTKSESTATLDALQLTAPQAHSAHTVSHRLLIAGPETYV